MKTAKLQIQNTNGEVLSEEILRIETGDKLIVQVPANATMHSVEKIYDHVRMMMENEELNVIVLPESISLKVLKIN
jgi:hypothetical protein